MIAFDGRPVVASQHAIEKALLRVPVVKGATKGGAALWIERTGSRALRDGRIAKTIPRWCCRGSRRVKLSARWGGDVRALWNEQETAVLIVQHVHEKTYRSGRRVWLVLTVLTPDRLNARIGTC